MRRLILLIVAMVAACAPAQPLPRADYAGAIAPRYAPQRANLVRVRKAARTLEVWAGSQPLLTLTGIQLGGDPRGAKQFEGDSRTPEGRYLINWRNPHSAYHLSLHVSYPSARETFEARALGRSAGGMIMIHGQPNGYSGRVPGDWTDGCIAVSDAEIEALWDIVPDGSVIEILP